MKALLGLLVVLFSTNGYANQKTNMLVCTVAYNYSAKIDLKNNTVDLWELAVSVGSIVGEDFIVQSKQQSNTFNYLLKKSGVISVTFDNSWGWGHGTWNHKGVLNAALTDADDLNQNGIAELSECYFE